MTDTMNQNGLQKTTGASESLPGKAAIFLSQAVSPQASKPEFLRGVFVRLLAWAVISVMLIVGVSACRAQDTPPSTPGEQTKAKQTASAEWSDETRLFGIMPAYGLVEVGMHPPLLSSGQKFKLAVQYLNPYTVFFVAVEAGVNQARNHPTEYGQGAEGYGKRFAAGFADGLTDGVLVTGVYPTVFHQDPRYYRLADGTFTSRVGYAVSRILITRQDSGRRSINISEVMGSFTSSAIGVAYYPQSERNFSDVAERAGIQFAFDAGFNLLKEFYPDIERKLFGKNHKR